MDSAAEGVICYLGIGSNQDDPAAQCLAAMDRLADIPGLVPVRQSSLYRTEPVGMIEQPWFINAVAEIRTVLEPRRLLEALQELERGMGRTGRGDGGPRIIDLDILFYGQAVIDEDGLVIPHGELHRRRFVLEPLEEIAPWLIHPRFGISVRGLLDRLEDAKKVEKAEG